MWAPLLHCLMPWIHGSLHHEPQNSHSHSHSLPNLSATAISPVSHQHKPRSVPESGSPGASAGLCMGQLCAPHQGVGGCSTCFTCLDQGLVHLSGCVQILSPCVSLALMMSCLINCSRPPDSHLLPPYRASTATSYGAWQACGTPGGAQGMIMGWMAGRRWDSGTWGCWPEPPSGPCPCMRMHRWRTAARAVRLGYNVFLSDTGWSGAQRMLASRLTLLRTARPACLPACLLLYLCACLLTPLPWFLFWAVLLTG